MSDKTKLGNRMKENYENRTKQFLTRRTNTIVRLDGKAFHTYTKNLDKPFDEGLIQDMQETTKFLCENIQGCKAGYTQSDEISLLLTDYDNLQTDAWFDGNVQKITSVSASLATAKFNDLRLKRNLYYNYEKCEFDLVKKEWDKNTLAFFDSRVFQIPEKEEVVNYFLWRQQDAERNSISMLAQSFYSHKQLFKKNSSDMQEMCFQKGQNWNDLHFSKKRGSLIVKNTYVNDEIFPPKDNSIFEENGAYFVIDPIVSGEIMTHSKLENPKIRTKWEVVETPIFSQNRNSILNLIKT